MAAPVVIVLTTYNPSAEFFKAQIESLKKQTYKNWFCLIADDCSSEESLKSIQAEIQNDSRFQLFSYKNNLGSVKNFERALQQVPLSAKYIFLCDQDDIWHSEKIEILLQPFQDAHVMLVHSDLRLVDSAGRLISLSCWDAESRNIETRNSNDIVFSNVFTGCSMAFRSDVLKKAIPFPSSMDKNSFHHDQWIALCANSMGLVHAHAEALMDYRQHGHNLVGSQELTSTHLIQKASMPLTWQSRALNALALRQQLAFDLQQRFPPSLELKLWSQKFKLFLFLFLRAFEDAKSFYIATILIFGLFFQKNGSND